jgi:hypothetical protein
MSRFTLLLALVAALLSAPVAEARPFIVGVNDDSMKWRDDPGTVAAVGQNLGLGAFRITLGWRPGKRVLTAADRTAFDRIATSRPTPRVVLTVMGVGRDAPRTAARRTEYCEFVRSVLVRYPGIRDVVVWNEANKSHFWLPQSSGGRPAAPAAYTRLLARCYDVLHRLRPNVNVISSTSPRVTTGGLSPVRFLTEMGLAYRALGRNRRLFDTVGHNVYPTRPGEPVTARHGGGTIGLGDYDILMATLRTAFAGTRQSLPGKSGVSIWYLETGFQTRVRAAKRVHYSGHETERRALSASTQGRQLSAAIRAAACQRGVGALFNFMLADEPELRGWQSGLLWADWTPKPGYTEVRRTVATVRAGNLRCR